MKKFSENFIFSTSTCSFQIEGGRELGGRTQSIWDKFTKENFYVPKEGEAKREINSIEVASDFYHRYEEDAKIMEGMGVNGFVYNMDWARIMPDDSGIPNEEGLTWTENMFKALIKHGVKPVVILYHWDTPLWLEEKGGTAGDYFVDAFKQFCEVVFSRLGKYVDVWYTNDENSSYTTLGYLDSYFPPMKNDPKLFWKALHNLNMSAAAAKEVFEIAKDKGNVNRTALLGIDHDWNPAVPYDENDADDLKACEIFNQYNLDLFLDPNIKGTYPQVFYDEIDKLGINPIKPGDLEYLKKHTLDLIGWNYYRPAIIAAPKRMQQQIEWFNSPSTFITKEAYIVFPKTMNYTSWKWLIKPEDLLPGSRYLYEKYKKPLMIIENGMGFFDKKEGGVVNDVYRIEFLNEHLRYVQEAISEGIPFIGYSLWTYCDIFSPSGGYRKKYGLVGVDFENKTLNRYPKASYYWYKDVIKNKTVVDKSEFSKYHSIAKENLGEWKC